MTSFFSLQKKIDKDLTTRDIGQELKDSFLVTSLYFAQLSYFSPQYIQNRLVELAAKTVSVYDKGDVQAVFAEFESFAVVSFKGRKMDRWHDIKTDLKFWKTDLHRHSIHSGFASSLKNVSRRIAIDLDELPRHKRTLFTGHSLGGALAHLMALEFKPTDLCTFGSPRVFHGNSHERHFAGIDVTRVVTNNDFVPSLPPKFTGYRHVGDPVVYQGKESKWDSHKLTTYLRSVVGKKEHDNDSGKDTP